MRYYIADLHAFHKGVNDRMDKRGFLDAESMNEYMIKQWNSKVRRNDEVVILGDLSLGRGTETNKFLKQLNGKKFLIKGNHDKFLEDKNFDTSLLGWVKDYAEMNDNGRKVILSHYPTMCYNGQFRRDENGNPKVWMLHGHVHFTQDCVGIEKYKEFIRSFPRASRGNDTPMPAPIQMINCFCMASDYVPLTLDDWIELEDSGYLKSQIQDDWFYDK